MRPPLLTDADSIAALMSSDVSRWLASWPAFITPEAAGVRIAEAQSEIETGHALHWLVQRRYVSQIMGWIRITRSDTQPTTGELGFWLGTSFHGFGFATEAVRAAIRKGFDHLGLTKVEGGAQVDNEASQRVMRRLGMRRADERSVWSPTRQRFEACIYYQIHKGTRNVPGGLPMGRVV